MIKWAMGMVLSLAAAAAGAQEAGIYVDGNAVLRVEPDVAMFAFAVQGQTDTAADAMQRADEISGELVRSLERLDVASEDIRSTPVMLNWFFDRQTQRELINFNRTTTAILRDLDRFEAVNEAAIEAGVNSMGAVQFLVSNAAELQARARDLALEDARNQAEAIAAAMGVRVGRVVSVRVSQPFVGPGPRGLEFGAVAADALAAAPEFRSGLIEIRSNANVSFEIIQP